MLADSYAEIAATHGFRETQVSASHYPTTALVDTFGKEVTYKSTWGTKVLR